MNPLLQQTIHFLVLAGLIVVAGMYLARFADQLGIITGLGSSMAGLILLATATSLPELAIGCNAALIPAPDLAVGDLLGSSLFNLLILATIDLLDRNSGRMFSRIAAAHALSAIASILLTALVLLFLIVEVPWPLSRIGPGSVAVLCAYLAGLRLIYNDQQVGPSEEAMLEREATKHPVSWKTAVGGFGAATLVILIVSPLLARTADEMSISTGLGGTFVGTVFVAMATSLPEVSTTYSAVRMGARDMAVGNVFGSNAFNMTALFGVDLFYDGSLLEAASPTHAVTATTVIIVTAVATMGLLYRAERRFWIIEPDAALVILLILGSLALVYFS